jgi:hypothetical protein
VRTGRIRWSHPASSHRRPCSRLPSKQSRADSASWSSTRSSLLPRSPHRLRRFPSRLRPAISQRRQRRLPWRLPTRRPSWQTHTMHPSHRMLLLLLNWFPWERCHPNRNLSWPIGSRHRPPSRWLSRGLVSQFSPSPSWLFRMTHRARRISSLTTNLWLKCLTSLRHSRARCRRLIRQPRLRSHACRMFRLLRPQP